MNFHITYLYSSDRGEWPTSHSHHFPPGKLPSVPIRQEAGWEQRKYSALGENQTTPVIQPTASHFTDISWLISCQHTKR